MGVGKTLESMLNWGSVILLLIFAIPLVVVWLVEKYDEKKSSSSSSLDSSELNSSYSSDSG